MKPLTAYNRAHKACLEIAAANNTPCWVCGQAINYRIDGAVHYITRGDPLDQANMAVVHKRCSPPNNSRRW